MVCPVKLRFDSLDDLITPIGPSSVPFMLGDSGHVYRGIQLRLAIGSGETRVLLE